MFEYLGPAARCGWDSRAPAIATKIWCFDFS
jgi:hypothetical protein